MTSTHYQPAYTGCFGRLIKFGFVLLLGGALYTAATHNMQPWFSIGADMINGYDVIPTFGLDRVVVIGGLIKWLSNQTESVLGAIIGGMIWAFTQFLQIFPLCIDNPEFLQDFIKASSQRRYQIANDGSWVDSMRQKYNSQPQDWWTAIKLLALASYAVEIVVAFWRYPPYAGGPDALLYDLANGQYSNLYLDWNNLGLMLVTIFAMETVMLVGILIWKGIRHFGVSARNVA